MKTVTIFSTPMCGYCKALKGYLDQEKIPYLDHDVTTDDKALEKMQKLTNGGTSVPVVVFNIDKSDQEVQIGYDVEKVQIALHA